MWYKYMDIYYMQLYQINSDERQQLRKAGQNTMW
jgi:hypothetical protein